MGPDRGNAVIILQIDPYILGHVLSSLSKWLYELFIVDVCLKRPYINLLSEKDSRVLKVAFPEYFIPLSEEIRQKIVGKKCIARDKADPEKLRGLYERAYAHVKDNKDASARLDTFLSLYGFCRTASFTLLVLAVSFFVTGPVWAGLVGLGLSIILFLRYLKFLRQHSYELFLS